MVCCFRNKPFFCHLCLMATLNIEIKATCPDPDRIRQWLLAHGARFVGVDGQTDTYFNVPNGRLKLREGNIENNLIFYTRTNQDGPKQSDFLLVKVADAAGLKESLTRANGIRTIVHKSREIYFIDNVKFHIDEVRGLGSFTEIEACNNDGEFTSVELHEQCSGYMSALQITADHLLSHSYSDMMIESATL